eukprot:CAMPEP_0185563184 /NCGR_PEP_ID=MMETSP1381-20130426/62975_1 /TAXON_ID=298111 /ORGANISM="Pavlova sp., Strain CCMP459" /LENGTH=96 /DNA_ID=CAMNT_0028177063 /DNA_START=23 /DNA_END=313 /DNA_ORIENTATION=+
MAIDDHHRAMMSARDFIDDGLEHGHGAHRGPSRSMTPRPTTPRPGTRQRTPAVPPPAQLRRMTGDTRVGARRPCSPVGWRVPGGTVRGPQQECERL